MRTQGSIIIKNVLLVIVFCTMLIPHVVSKLHKEEFHPLKGAYTVAPNVVFDKKEWLNGSYQKSKEEYLNTGFGLRALFVRVNNQIAYTLFNKAKANGVVIGKENYLYEEGYINAYTGKDYIGDDSISAIVKRLAFISDTLDKMGKKLIVVLAPGKASFYPEYIPDHYGQTSQKTNYSQFSKTMAGENLHIVDFNKWFIDHKSTSAYPLYPKTGIHWSTYATALVADSISKYIGYLRNTKLARVKITGIEMKKPYDADYDIADGMNLLFKCSSFDMAYPKVTFDQSQQTDKPKVLVISDSFYWGLYNLGISNCFADDHFWYYNKQVYPESFTNELLTDHVLYKEELKKHDVFVIMSTEATLHKIGWGFIEKADKAFKGINVDEAYLKSPQYKKKLNDFIAYIKTQPQWMNDARIRAKEKNISLDSNLVLEALWQLQNQK